MRRSAQILFLLSLVGSVAAQGYTTDFEAFTAAPAGFPCAPQDSFYVPAVAGSIDGAIYTYAGNTIGVTPNALGGANFYAGVSAGGTAFARSQRAITFPAGRIHIAWDVQCNYNPLPTTPLPVNNIGSFSFQPSTASTYVNVVARWPVGVVFPPTTWNADVVAGTLTPPTTATTVLPNPAFQGLAVGVWHRWGVTVDLAAGVHVDFRITNGVTGITTVYTPAVPLLLPSVAVPGPPTDFRLFTGGTTAGNLFAVDNLTITYGANYTTFGAGCPGALGVPTLAAAPGSLPVIGGPLTVNLGGLPVGFGLMLTGLSNTLFGGAIPLPLPLGSVGYPGCDLLVDPLIADIAVSTGPTTASWTFLIPPVPSFRGIVLYNQGVSLDTGPTSFTFSNGGCAVIGL